MNTVSKALIGIIAAVSLCACSSSAASSKAASSAASSSSSDEVKADYTETADADSMEYKDGSVQNVTFQVPSTWKKKLESQYNETDYKSTDSKDKIEVRYIEGDNSDLKGLIDLTEWLEPFTLKSTEDAQVAGVTALHAKGTSIIYNTIMYDCNADMYLIPVDGGTVVFEFLQDPNGTTDYQPVFDKVISTVAIG